MPPEALNYVWVGPPKSQKGGELASDIAKVIEMAKNITNPISFYCLDENKPHYIDILREQGVTNIAVESISTYINKVAKQNPGLEKDALQMIAMKDLLLTPPRNDILDRVSFKDAFVLFLLASKGGYTIDTNIAFDVEKAKKMSGGDEYTFPSFNEVKIPYNGMHTPEVWLMYAPQHSSIAKRMLNFYLTTFDSIQNKYQQNAAQNEPVGEEQINALYEYHGAITTLMVHDSVYRCVDASFRMFPEEFDDDEQKYGVRETIKLDPQWKYEMVLNLLTATMPALPIEKKYENSHKPWFKAHTLLEKNFEVLKSKMQALDSLFVDHLSDIEHYLRENQVTGLNAKYQQGRVNQIMMLMDKLVGFEEACKKIASLPSKHPSEKMQQLEKKMEVELQLAYKEVVTSFATSPEFASKDEKQKIGKMMETTLPQLQKELEKQHNIDNSLSFKDKLRQAIFGKFQQTERSQEKDVPGKGM